MFLQHCSQGNKRSLKSTAPRPPTPIPSASSSAPSTVSGHSQETELAPSSRLWVECQREARPRSGGWRCGASGAPSCPVCSGYLSPTTPATSQPEEQVQEPTWSPAGTSGGRGVAHSEFSSSPSPFTNTPTPGCHATHCTHTILCDPHNAGPRGSLSAPRSAETVTGPLTEHASASGHGPPLWGVWARAMRPKPQGYTVLSPMNLVEDAALLDPGGSTSHPQASVGTKRQAGSHGPLERAGHSAVTIPAPCELDPVTLCSKMAMAAATPPGPQNQRK